MTAINPVLVETTRGDFLENAHRGAIAVCDPSGDVVFAVGDIDRTLLPRSAIKLLQALPLVESGAADARRLDDRRLALACASHAGAAAHADLAGAWLADLGLSEGDLMCGPQTPGDPPTRDALVRAGQAGTALHNNCSGKHSGFLTLAQHLGAPTADYIAIDHPAQKAVAEAFAEATGAEAALGWAVDGCSAPNFASTLRALAGAAARVARPEQGFGPGVRARAAARLRDATTAHPFEVAGEGRACTEMMRACEGRASIKTGAEGCFIGYLTDAGLGVALRIDDGDTAAAQCVMAAMLARYGAAPAQDPRIARFLAPTLRNRRGVETGVRRATAALQDAPAR